MTLRERLHALLRLGDPPQRIATALAVGVFISCTPFWGLQTILSVAVAMVFGLNRAATVTGTWLNLPWFAPFVYGLALRIGMLLTPGRGPVRPTLRVVLDRSEGFVWRHVLDLLHTLSVSLLVGTTVLGAAAAIVTYVASLALLSRHAVARPDRPAPVAPGRGTGYHEHVPVDRHEE